jgi:hypothetical protein
MSAIVTITEWASALSTTSPALKFSWSSCFKPFRTCIHSYSSWIRSGTLAKGKNLAKRKCFPRGNHTGHTNAYLERRELATATYTKRQTAEACPMRSSWQMRACLKPPDPSDDQIPPCTKVHVSSSRSFGPPKQNHRKASRCLPTPVGVTLEYELQDCAHTVEIHLLSKHRNWPCASRQFLADPTPRFLLAYV